MKLHRSKGVALIVVLLILAVMVTLSAQMTERTQVVFKRTAALVHYQQAFSYLLGAQSFLEMYIDGEINRQNTVHLGQTWAKPKHQYPIDEGTLEGSVTDLRSLFNINSLGNTNKNVRMQSEQLFYKLMLQLEIDDSEAQDIARQTRIWMTTPKTDDEQNDAGSADVIYQAKSPQYRASLRLLFDLSELRAIEGITRDIYQRLAPYLCVVPGDTSLIVNVNTASKDKPEILSVLLSPYGSFSAAEIDSLLSQRPETGWKNQEDFFRILNPLLEQPLDENSQKNFQVTSSFFEAKMTMKLNDIQQSVRLLIEKTKNNPPQTKRRIFGDDA